MSENDPGEIFEHDNGSISRSQISLEVGEKDLRELEQDGMVGRWVSMEEDAVSGPGQDSEGNRWKRK